MISHSDTGVVASKVYFPEEECIHVHQTRTSLCPVNFPNGFFWYGRQQSSNSKPYPQWVDAVYWPAQQEVEEHGIGDLTTDDSSADASALPPEEAHNDVAEEVAEDNNQEVESDPVDSHPDLEDNMRSSLEDTTHGQARSTEYYSLRKAIRKPLRFRDDARGRAF